MYRLSEGTEKMRKNDLLTSNLVRKVLNYIFTNRATCDSRTYNSYLHFGVCSCVLLGLFVLNNHKFKNKHVVLPVT